MYKKLIILNIFILILTTGTIFPQAKRVFSGEPEKFKDELVGYMGPNLSGEQKTILNSFIAKWDSTSFSEENRTRILDLSNQLTGRQLRAGTQFSQFLKAINDFVET